MANVKITDLSNYPVVLSSSSDVLAIVDVTNNITKKITVDNLFSGRSNRVGMPGATATSITLQTPQGLQVNNASTATITTAGTFALTWSGSIPLTSLAINAPSASTFLRGDSMWAVPPGTAGTVNYLGLVMPSIFQTPVNSVTTVGVLTVVWDGLSGNKIPTLNLGGVIPSGLTASNSYLRGDGSWQTPTGQGLGTVSSVTLSMPQGLLVNGQTSSANISNTPFAITWDILQTIPLTVLGSQTPTNVKFLRGDGWYSTQSVFQKYTALNYLGSLATTSAIGDYSIVLSGQYSSVDIPSGTTLYFGANGTQGYVVEGIVGGLQTTDVTFTTQLAEVHFATSPIYKYVSPGNYELLVFGSNLTTRQQASALYLQNTTTPASWLLSTLIPTANQGNAGQYDFVSSDSSIYLKEDANSWVRQTQLENTIDTRTLALITDQIGSQNVINSGGGYKINYQFTVQAVNLNTNVVITGFKYITVDGNINILNLTLVAPPTGWTLGNYANLALAFQMAVNALSDAVPISVTNDDSNLILSVETDIPSVLTTPNPPLFGDLNPLGVQIGSFISSFYITGAIGAASFPNKQWTFTQPFDDYLELVTVSELEGLIAYEDVFRGTIPKPASATGTSRQDPISSTAAVNTGWTWAPGTVGSVAASMTHAGDVRSQLNFVTGDRLSFRLGDFFGFPVGNIVLDGGGNTKVIFFDYAASPGVFSTTDLVYKITNYVTPILAGTNTLLNFSATSQIPGLTYSNGVFTSTTGVRTRYSFSLQVSGTLSTTYIDNNSLSITGMVEMDIWFNLNNTDPNSYTSRRGQVNWEAPQNSSFQVARNLRDNLLSANWVFSLNPNDTVTCNYWCDAHTFIYPNFGVNASTTDGAILTVVGL